jgi:hypothetical protein
VFDRMKGMPWCQRLREPSDALAKKWAVLMSVWVVGMGCRLDMAWGGGWCVVLWCESSSRDRKKRVGAVGHVV